MRILILSTNGVITDGITSWLLQTCSMMDKSGFTLETVAFENAPQDALSKLDAADVTVHTLPSRRQRPIAYLRALRKLIKQRSYDVIHVNGNSGTVALELLCCSGTQTRTRIVHSRNTQGNHKLMDFLLRPIMNRLTTHRLACGRDAGRWLFGKAEFTVIPNGRDFTDYAFSNATRLVTRAMLGLNADDIAVGHVGNFIEQKNHRFLIDVFAEAKTRNPKLKLFLIGEGTLRKEIEARCEQRGVSDYVRFIGRSGRVSDYLSAFDLALLPSLHEGFPNVVIEWQVNGLPSLISSDITQDCALTELVRILPLAHSAEWARAISSFAPTERSLASASAQSVLRDAGYEARQSVHMLRATYLSILS